MVDTSRHRSYAKSLGEAAGKIEGYPAVADGQSVKLYPLGDYPGNGHFHIDR